MSDFLKSYPLALRHCIRDEFLQGTLIDEAYSKFCSKIGEDFMEYREFEYWYRRFSEIQECFNRQGFVHYNMCKDDETYEPTDMPIGVLTKIVECLDIFDRMSDFMKSNPMALRHCLLYEYLRKNPVEKSFTDLCMTVGPGVIKKEEFQVWFDKFNQGIFDMEDGKEPKTDMKDVLRSDKHALRACILYESIRYKQAERGYLSYKLWFNNDTFVYKIKRNRSFFFYCNFCKMIGDDVIEYREFDFWFYRFLNGVFDLNYEREKDEKIHELSNVPLDVMKYIVEYLNVYDRIKLARTSRSLQTFVEDQKLFHRTLRLEVELCDATVYDGIRLGFSYLQYDTDCLKRIRGRETWIKDATFWREALWDFEYMLKNPKLHLETLEIRLMFEEGDQGPFEPHANAFSALEDALKFTHYLNVKELILVTPTRSSDQFSKILSSLKPGYLTKISISSYSGGVVTGEVFQMEQWKQAKYFDMSSDRFVGPLIHLYHFKEFNIEFSELTVENIREMKEILFISPDFEKCEIRLHIPLDMETIGQEFGDPIRGRQISFQYSIPDSTEYFETELKPHMNPYIVEITRKKK